MNRFSETVVKLRIYILVFVLIAAAVCAFLMGKVGVNYDNASYLDKHTQTAIALDIMEKEFGLTGNIQMMIPDISADEADSIADDINDMDNVLNAKFDADDKNYYKDRNALFVITTDGDDYSEELNTLADNLKSKYSDKGAYLAGSGYEKKVLEEKITTQVPIMLVISIAIVLIILLLMATSWLEPIMFLLVAGIGIVINRGTNVFLGDISYITNSVAAILQLALSMDYSIILLNRYHKEQLEVHDDKKAMSIALLDCLNPVSCSALTTIAGLFALVFMNFKIGFDIGIVLMKGIVISAVLVFTMLPGVIVLCDGLLKKTKKKPISLRSNMLAGIAMKKAIPVTAIAVVFVIAGCTFSSHNSYEFSANEAAADSAQIEKVFGITNQVAVTYKTGTEEESIAEQKQIVDFLESKNVLKDYTSYENTVLEQYHIKDAADKFDISVREAKQLFTMYQLYNNEISVKMSLPEFISYAQKLVNTDSDAKEYINSDTVKTINEINDIYNLMSGSNTAGAFYSSLSKYADINRTDVKNIYRLYAFENGYVRNDKVKFKTMLDYVLSNRLGGNTAQLKKLSDSIDKIESTFNQKLSQEDIKNLLSGQYGVQQLQAAYIAAKVCPEGEKIKYINLMEHLEVMGLLNSDQIKQIAVYEQVLDDASKAYPYDEFSDCAADIAHILTGKRHAGISDDKAKQLYIKYLGEKGRIPDISVRGTVITDFMTTNSMVSSMLSSKNKDQLDDMKTVYDTFSKKGNYTYEQVYSKVSRLQKNIKTDSTAQISQDKVSGIFIKYAVAGKLYSKNPVTAENMVNFLYDNMDTNELLRDRIDDQKRTDIENASDDISRAKNLFKGDNYSRYLINVSIPVESQESFEFVEQFNDELKAVYGDEAYAAGEMITTYDLKESFAHDLKLISIFTVISMLVIVLLTFRSLSIPVILVLAIQGSIWISMSMSYITGNSIFFMSYIVAVCILMGATIDYGILVSSYYLESRRTMERRDAIANALKTALPSIFTSGLILITAGLVVHFVSSEIAISQVGLLLGRGTIVSVLMILLVLPSLLVLLDKVVMKTTLTRK